MGSDVKADIRAAEFQSKAVESDPSVQACAVRYGTQSAL